MIIPSSSFSIIIFFLPQPFYSCFFYYCCHLATIIIIKKSFTNKILYEKIFLKLKIEKYLTYKIFCM
jgi:hypothetical protein